MSLALAVCSPVWRRIASALKIGDCRGFDLFGIAKEPTIHRTSPIVFSSMTEHIVRSNLLELELLARYSAPSLADIGPREIETFRASAGLHPDDQAWLELTKRWQAERGESAEHISELQTWTDANLFDILLRDASANAQADAALELYRRGSKFIHSEEFEPFRTACIDRELKERRAGHDPTRVLDGLQRLNQKHERNAKAIDHVDRARRDAEDALDKRHTATADEIRSSLEARAASLQQGMTEMKDAIAQKVKKLAVWFGSINFVVALAIILHIAHVL